MSNNADRYASRKVRKNKGNNRVAKQEQGVVEILEETTSLGRDYDTSWFKPLPNQALAQSHISNPEIDCVIIEGPAGTGKSSTAIAKALVELRKGNFKHIVFCKTPAEYGDDQIGYLNGSCENKLEKHFEVMRNIFLDFMDKVRLKKDEERGIIKFTIPNFLAGATLYDTLLIIDETQTLSDTTLKLVLERLGEGSKVFVLGDGKQCYAAKKRKDGFTDFINKVTNVDADGYRYSNEEIVAYVKLTTNDNMRSRFSKRVTELYD